MAKLSELAGILNGQNAKLDLIAAGVAALKTQVGDPELSPEANQNLETLKTKIGDVLASVTPTPPAVP